MSDVKWMDMETYPWEVNPRTKRAFGPKALFLERDGGEVFVGQGAEIAQGTRRGRKLMKTVTRWGRREPRQWPVAWATMPVNRLEGTPQTPRGVGTGGGAGMP
jgi:hypothetical protein